jgi:hypothetical protein
VALDLAGVVWIIGLGGKSAARAGPPAISATAANARRRLVVLLTGEVGVQAAFARWPAAHEMAGDASTAAGRRA